MKPPKFTELLVTLSDKELHAFELFLASPFFGKNNKQRYIELLQVMKQVHLLQLKSLLKIDDQIYKLMNQNSPFSKRRYKNIQSELRPLLEEFLIFDSIQKKPRAKKQFYIDAIAHRSFDQFEMAVTSLIEEIEETTPYLSNTDFYSLHQVHHQLWFHPQNPQHTIKSTTLQKSMKYLDQFYIQTKLFYACEVLNRKSKLNENIPIPFLNTIFDYLKQHPTKTKSLSSIFFKIYQLFDKEDTPLFFKLKKQLIRDKKLIDGPIPVSYTHLTLPTICSV